MLTATPGAAAEGFVPDGVDPVVDGELPSPVEDPVLVLGVVESSVELGDDALGDEAAADDELAGDPESPDVSADAAPQP
ncbi:hypothetical protein CIW52_04595 [Mycolicibacterium sp. P9-64]|uniref:hypothetical protein n=1 Tax=Mycolicibacterium sp. P9-64 TaxID=2024612 RepID=UPI0011EF2970|nr:hypothetical protein [Mycolicibacterium sp. P9-64]KAA0085237.1 hypothetical protein CIW52_04595 [Mycolicibacterium sp. P9-64]